MLLYRLINRIFRPIFTLVFSWDVRGRENIPVGGPLIVCSNHISLLDPPLIGCSLWPRICRFMAKEELFHIPFFRHIMWGVRAFPVRRASADHRAIKTALDILKEDGTVCLFPEGTRSKTNELLPAQPGVGLIAIKSRVPVLPVAITGTYKLFGSIKVRIGSPLLFSEYYGQKNKAEDLERVSAIIMSEIARIRSGE